MWRDLGQDAKLAKVMEQRSGSPTAYLHQSESLYLVDGSPESMVLPLEVEGVQARMAVWEDRTITEAWMDDYNHRRPHSGLGGLTPDEVARR